MRPSSLILRSAILAAAVLLVAPLATLAQTFSAATGTDAMAISTPPPAAAHVAVPKNAEDKLLYGRVRDGVYTVDGMVAKVQLNYDVAGARFVYLFVPGMGTAVLSLVADPDAVTTQAQLHDGELSFLAGDHSFKLTGVSLVNFKGKAPDHLYARLDRSAWQLSRRPMVGFGNLAEGPYQWPGALASNASSSQPEESQVIVPPVPVSLLPSTRAVVPATPPATVNPVTLRPVALQR